MDTFDRIARVFLMIFGVLFGVIFAVLIASTIGMLVAPYASESTVNLVEFPSMGAGAVIGALVGYFAGRKL